MNILIVGATSGIGHALWQHYSSSGNRVIAMGRRKELLDRMSCGSDGNTDSRKCDIADIECFKNEFAGLVESYKQLDLIIVCAGIGELNPELDVETELSTISVNVVGWTNVVDIACRHMETRGKGHLVALTSVGGMQPTPVSPAYSASKAFQINYIKSLQKKYKNTDIVVTEIRPGLVDTRMAKGDGLFWVMPIDKVVAKIIGAIGRKCSRCIVTGRWRIVNFLLKHFA